MEVSVTWLDNGDLMVDAPTQLRRVGWIVYAGSRNIFCATDDELNAARTSSNGWGYSFAPVYIEIGD